MENDFLDGIDEAFQRLMKHNGNGKRNGRSREDGIVAEIVDHLHGLSKPQQEEVLNFVRALRKQKAE